MEARENIRQFQEKLMEDALEKALLQNEDQRQRWHSYKKGHEDIIKALSTFLKELKTNIMVPLGKRAFLKGQLIHTNEILASIGEDYFAKYSAHDAIELCKRRIKSAEEMLEHLQKERDLYETRQIVSVENDAFGRGESKEINEFWEQKEVDDWKKQHREREKEYRQKLAEIRKQEPKKIETEEDLFERLDQLEIEEELADELNRLEEDESSEEYSSDSNLSEEIEEELNRLKEIRMQKEKQDSNQYQPEIRIAENKCQEDIIKNQEVKSDHEEGILIGNQQNVTAKDEIDTEIESQVEIMNNQENVINKDQENEERGGFEENVTKDQETEERGDEENVINSEETKTKTKTKTTTTTTTTTKPQTKNEGVENENENEIGNEIENKNEIGNENENETEIEKKNEYEKNIRKEEESLSKTEETKSTLEVPKMKKSVSFPDFEEKKTDSIEDPENEPIRIEFSHSKTDIEMQKNVPSEINSPSDIYKVFGGPKSILKRRENDLMRVNINFQQGIDEEDEEAEEDVEAEIGKSLYESVVKDITERQPEVVKLEEPTEPQVPSRPVSKFKRDRASKR